MASTNLRNSAWTESRALVDYVTLADGDRFAFTFKGMGERDGKPTAHLRAFHFDDGRLLARDRPTLENINSLLAALRREP